MYWISSCFRHTRETKDIVLKEYWIPRSSRRMTKMGHLHEPHDTATTRVSDVNGNTTILFDPRKFQDADCDGSEKQTTVTVSPNFHPEMILAGLGGGLPQAVAASLTTMLQKRGLI